MIFVLILISVIFISLCFANDSEEMATFSLAVLGLKLIAMVFLIGAVINGRVIEQKIELLETRNQEIEEKVKDTVRTYMEYEGKTYADLKIDSYINLVNLYPDLKSDELIKSEIELYQKNTEEITNLKMEKINISNYKWWLYFGK